MLVERHRYGGKKKMLIYQAMNRSARDMADRGNSKKISADSFTEMLFLFIVYLFFFFRFSRAKYGMLSMCIYIHQNTLPLNRIY